MVLRERVAQFWHRLTAKPGRKDSGSDLAALVDAHGANLALLAVILDRANVISSRDFARELAAFAIVTEIDQPNAGKILSGWALGVAEAARALNDSGAAANRNDRSTGS